MGFPWLNELKLSHNNIINFPELSAAPRLETPALSNNKTSVIPAVTMSSLTRLKEVDLSYNKIKTVQAHVSLPTQLSSLLLNNNSIGSISDLSSVIDSLSTPVIDISGNPLHCGEWMCWMKRPEMYQIINLKMDAAPCASPEQHVGIPWQDVRADMLGCGKLAVHILQSNNICRVNMTPSVIFVRRPRKRIS